MDDTEWESLCDGCARCCLVRLQDEESEEIKTTNLSCKLLNQETCRCSNYPNRQDLVSDCLDLRKEDSLPTWLPSSCAYIKLSKGEELEDWHPLVSGNPNTVHQAGISVRGKTLGEEHIHPEQLPYHIVEWFDNNG